MSPYSVVRFTSSLGYYLFASQPVLVSILSECSCPLSLKAEANAQRIRWLHSATTIDNKIYIFGGLVDDRKVSVFLKAPLFRLDVSCPLSVHSHCDPWLSTLLGTAISTNYDWVCHSLFDSPLNVGPSRLPPLCSASTIPGCSTVRAFRGGNLTAVGSSLTPGHTTLAPFSLTSEGL